MKNKFAFTLAEVLITLGVIGVVAAITIPGLITNYQKQQTVTKLKKVYAELNQAFRLSMAENGDFADWEVSSDTSRESAVDFCDKYIVPYIKVLKKCGTDTTGDCAFKAYKMNGDEFSANDYTIANSTKIFLMNGSTVIVKNFTGQVFLTVDINGPEKPNIYGKDIFPMEVGKTSVSPKVSFRYIKSADETRDFYIAADRESGHNCSKQGSGVKCGALILNDGWKIAKDYPW